MRRFFTSSAVFLVLLLNLSCGAFKTKSIDPQLTPEGEVPNLSLGEAESRAARLQNLKYKLDVQVDETENFAGQVLIEFELLKNDRDLRLDFYKGEILKFEINGQLVAEPKRTTTKIWLPTSSLQLGKNKVFVSYKSKMLDDGTGLTRSVDPIDQSVYLHTHFQTFYANYFTPMFDQPDLKAEFVMNVRAPRTWQVISATRESKIRLDGKAFRVWSFPATEKISSYLISLHAGPFKVWEDKYKKIPLRVYARKSLAKHVDPSLWFKLTKQGLQFFETYFDYPYPFHKYDQLLVPDFAAGAMENVAAVTFNERLIHRTKPTRQQEHDLANIIFHEMAHMWFGNLTTMKWWGDLWLNESFATYMAALAVAEGTDYKESWQDAYLSDKQWAYYQDELSTTHPIESQVKDVLDAWSNYDGITYGKGAAVMKQLSFWMGRDSFRAGARDYFKTHAFKNTVLADFIGSMQKHTTKDLNAWANLWLRQAGLDIVRVNPVCEGRELRQLAVSSEPSARNSQAKFRSQAFEVGLYSFEKGVLTLNQTLPVNLNQSKLQLPTTGPCPDLVVMNRGDHGYGLFELDPKSLKSAELALSTIKDPMDRTLLWGALWQAVRDQKLSLTQYLEIAVEHLPKEKDLPILRFVVHSLSPVRSNDASSVLGYLAPGRGDSVSSFEQAVAKLEKLYFGQLTQAKAGSEEQQLWWDARVSVSQSDQALKTLSDALKSGRGLPRGFQLDQDRRWAVITQLCRWNQSNCLDLILAEKKRDPSDRGARAALAASAVRPDSESKTDLFQTVLHSKELPHYSKRALSRNLFPYEQRSAIRSIEVELFQFIEKNKDSDDLEFVTEVASDLAPIDCTPVQSNKVEKFISQKTLPAPLKRELRERLDEDLRCQKVRAKLQ